MSNGKKQPGLFLMQEEDYRVIPFHLTVTETKLERFIDANPFVPDAKGKRDRRCDEILTIQAMGLKKRLEHTKSQCAVLGISGGLDSTQERIEKDWMQYRK